MHTSFEKIAIFVRECFQNTMRRCMPSLMLRSFCSEMELLALDKY